MGWWDGCPSFLFFHEQHRGRWWDILTFPTRTDSSTNRLLLFSRVQQPSIEYGGAWAQVKEWWWRRDWEPIGRDWKRILIIQLFHLNWASTTKPSGRWRWWD